MEKKKDIIRVAHVVGKWVGGGVEAVIMNYYRNINHDKIQFDFIFDNDSEGIPYKEIESLGGRVILIPPYQRIFRYHKELKKVLKDGNYKIVHSHINVLSVFSLYAAKKAGVPVRIAHSHSTTNKIEWKKNLLKMLLKPFSKLFATDYFACTEHAGRWLFGDKAFEEGKVFILNNAIDLNKFKYDENIRKKKRKELNINEDTLVMGHIGRFVAQKNHEFVIDIFREVHKQNRNSILLLIGQGPLQKEIRQKVNELGLNECIVFLEQRDDTNELYQAFDIFILPSLYEGLGMVLIEAQASGLPCICSTEVPNSAKVTDNLKFINLLENSEFWKNESIKFLDGFIRKDCVNSVQRFGYDIDLEKKNLENYYLNK